MQTVRSIFLDRDRGRLLLVSNISMRVIDYRHTVKVKRRGGDRFHLVESTHTHTHSHTALCNEEYASCIDRCESFQLWLEFSLSHIQADIQYRINMHWFVSPSQLKMSISCLPKKNLWLSVGHKSVQHCWSVAKPLREEVGVDCWAIALCLLPTVNIGFF